MENDQVLLLFEQLNRLFNHYKAHYDGNLQNPEMMKIKPVEQKLLGLLEWQNSIGIKEVVQSLGLPNSTVTSAVARMIDKGLIIKEVDENDRRAYLLKLTPKGDDIVAYGRYLKMRFSEEILDGYETEGEGQKLIALLTDAVTSLDKIHDDPTRSDFMNSLQQEYHGFGPWLIEIKSEGEIPQQYLSQKDRILAAEFSFKVPVKVDRHRLRPGMLMYNTIVCIYSDRLLIFKMEGDQLNDYEMPLDAVRYLCSSRELLDSHIVLGTDEQTFDIDYNSVSNEISAYVMQLLRKKIFTPFDGVDSSVYMPESDVPEDVFRTMTNMIYDEGSFIVLGYQPKVRVERRFASTAENILYSHRRYDLQDVLFVSNGKELICVDYVHEVKTSDEPDYSYRYFFIRLDSISGLEYLEEPLIEGVQSLVIKAGDSSVAFKVGEDFDNTYLKRYLKL